MMDRQLSIDFDRARQLGLIKNWRPQTVGQVSGLTLKAVLAQINHYGRGRICFVSQSRLCQECGIGERTCRRAIAVLQQLGVIIAIRMHAVEGTRLTRNQYRIVWTELEVIVERQGRYQPARAKESMDPSATSADPTVSCAVQRATSVDRLSFKRSTDRPDAGADQQALRSYQQAMRDNQQAIWDDQQATSGRLHGITRIETNNNTAPLTPKVDPDHGGGLGADDIFEKPVRPRATKQPQSEIERLLAGEGIELWARCAAEFAALGPGVIRLAIATYRANRAKLKGPQAIVFALRNGIWPAKGLPPLKPPDPPEVQDARRMQEQHRRLAQNRETLRYEIIVAGRRKKLADREIGQQLVARGLDPEGFLDESIEIN